MQARPLPCHPRIPLLGKGPPNHPPAFRLQPLFSTQKTVSIALPHAESRGEGRLSPTPPRAGVLPHPAISLIL